MAERPRTPCVGLAETSRLIRAAAERRSTRRRREDAVVQGRLAARQASTEESQDPSVLRERHGGAPGTG